MTERDKKVVWWLVLILIFLLVCSTFAAFFRITWEQNKSVKQMSQSTAQTQQAVYVPDPVDNGTMELSYEDDVLIIGGFFKGREGTVVDTNGPTAGGNPLDETFKIEIFDDNYELRNVMVMRRNLRKVN
jgi:hypothetical protein